VASAGPALGKSGRHPWTLAVLGVAHAGAGRADLAEAVYAELQVRWRQERTQCFWIADVAAALGRTEEAMAWATRAVEEREPFGLFMSRWPGFSEVVEGHPGLPGLLAKLGIA